MKSLHLPTAARTLTDDYIKSVYSAFADTPLSEVQRNEVEKAYLAGMRSTLSLIFMTSGNLPEAEACVALQQIKDSIDREIKKHLKNTDQN